MKLKFIFLKKVLFRQKQTCLSIALITEMVLNPVLIPWTIYAQEADPTPTPTVTIEEITPSPTPSPAEASAEAGTPTPTETSSSTTTTGDAASSASTDIIANSTSTTVDGEIGASDCTPSGSVSCPVDIDNSATADASTSASSTSGGNSTTNALGDGSINSGTSSAAAVTTTDLNLNIIDATESAIPAITVTPTPGGSSVSTDNKADSKTTTTADSTSGGNDASGNGGNAGIKAGDSYSSAATVNFINTNLIGSNYRFLIYNIYATENATINLNEIWKEIEAAMGQNATIVPSEANTLAISIKNDANVKDVVSATATSGDNSANDNGGNVTIVTGNSFASANLFNLINTNIIGANFVFVIINIFGTLNGDIVVPSQERFNESMAAYDKDGAKLSAGSVIIDNYARVEGSKALADANSGNNQSSGTGDQTTTTGNAYASATTFDVLNTTLSWENWMSFIINNFGSWAGSVKGWGDPTSSTQAAANTSTTLDHSTGPGTGDLLTSSNEPNGTNSSNTTIENTATVSSNVSAKANSGDNQANDNGGDTSIATGMAIALANVFNFINTNIFGGRFLFVFINLFGRWNGDFVLAHPDLKIEISADHETVDPGQEVAYTISYINKGYEDAQDAVVDITFPKDIIYINNSLGKTPNISGSQYSFPIGNVLWGKGGSFTIGAKVNNSISPDEQTSNSLFEKLKDKIIAKAYAQNKEKNLVINAQITMINPVVDDSDKNNNMASTTTKVVIPEAGNNDSNSSNETNFGTPKLEVTSSHNVGEYVYPGDIVTFFVTIKNTGDSTAHNVKVYQHIYDGTPDPLGTVSFDIGNVESQKALKLTYGLTIPNTVIPGMYHSNIFAEGNSESGEKITSNQSFTDFLVKERYSGFVQPVQAQEESTGQENNVLGEQTTPPCKKEKDYLPYVLSGILAILWFIDHLRRKRLEKELKSALNKEG